MNKIILGLIIVFLAVLSTYTIETLAQIPISNIPAFTDNILRIDNKNSKDIYLGGYNENDYISFCPIDQRDKKSGCCKDNDSLSDCKRCCPSGNQCRVEGEVCKPTICTENRNENTNCCNLDFLKNCLKCCDDGITCEDNSKCPSEYCSKDVREDNDCCPNIDGLEECERCCPNGITCKEEGKLCPIRLKKKKIQAVNFARIASDPYQITFETDELSYDNNLYSTNTLKTFQDECKNDLSKHNYPINFKSKLIGYNSAYTNLPGTSRGICQVIPYYEEGE